MENQPESPSWELGRYARVLARRWPTVLLGCLVGLGLAAGYLLVRPPAATATAVVNVNVISENPFNPTREPSGLIDQQTEVQTARSSEVLNRAADQVGGDASATEIRQGLAVTLLPDATVVRITYTGGDADNAVAVTNAVAEQYLAFRGELATNRLEAIAGKLQSRRDELGDQLRDVNERLASAPANSPRAAQAESDRQLLNLELDNLLGEINSTVSIDTTGGTVLTPATSEAVYFTPKKSLVALGGLLLGLLLGVVGAFVRDRTDRRVDNTEDVVLAGGGHLLGTVPAGVPVSQLLQPGGLETMRSLREVVIARQPHTQPVLTVVDVDRDSKGYPVAVGLGLAIAENGRRTEVLLTEYTSDAVDTLVKELNLQELARTDRAVSYGLDAQPTLRVTVVGADEGGEPAARALPTLVRKGQDTDVTVIGLSPGANQSTRLAAGRLGRAVVAVVRRRRTRSADLHRLAEQMTDVGARIHGTVMLTGRS